MSPHQIKSPQKPQAIGSIKDITRQASRWEAPRKTNECPLLLCASAPLPSFSNDAPGNDIETIHQPQSVPPFQHYTSDDHKPCAKKGHVFYRGLYHPLHDWSRRLCPASHYGLLTRIVRRCDVPSRKTHVQVHDVDQVPVRTVAGGIIDRGALDVCGDRDSWAMSSCATQLYVHLIVSLFEKG